MGEVKARVAPHSVSQVVVLKNGKNNDEYVLTCEDTPEPRLIVLSHDDFYCCPYCGENVELLLNRLRSKGGGSA